MSTYVLFMQGRKKHPIRTHFMLCCAVLYSNQINVWRQVHLNAQCTWKSSLLSKSSLLPIKQHTHFITISMESTTNEQTQHMIRFSQLLFLSFNAFVFRSIVFFRIWPIANVHTNFYLLISFMCCDAFMRMC